MNDFVIKTAIEFSRYFAALLFGMAVAVNFVGMPRTPRHQRVLCCYAIILFMVQLLCLFNLGMDTTIKIYPLITHLPTIAYMAIYLKRPWLESTISMFASYLCTQPARWIGSVAGEFFGNASMNHLGYIVSVVFLFIFLKKYVAASVRHMIERSAKSCMIFGAVPAFYYFVDHTTTVYTDFLYRGTRAAVQFMPFVISAFYFVFVLFYHSEIQKQAKVERERDILEMQFRQSQAELASLRLMQQNAATYRHDMRHHIALLQGLASKGRIEEINEYLRTAESDIDAITPVRYCENETVNLILSSYASKANQSGVLLTIDAKLPEKLSLSDTDLCSLLSNTLENAIHASEKIAEIPERQVKLRVFSKNNKLCIDIRNRYHAEPVFREGIPVSVELGHGFGTKSMIQIVEKHGGVFQFAVKDGWFIFQATS